MATAPAPYSRASPPAGYADAHRCSFDYPRGPPPGAATPAPAVPAAVSATPELACGSFMQAMQEAAAAAPRMSQPLHQAQQAQRVPGGPCVFNMLDWNEALPDRLLAP